MLVPELVTGEKEKILNFYVVKLLEKLPKRPNFGLNILAWATFLGQNIFWVIFIVTF